jgi:hypothetical protein
LMLLMMLLMMMLKSLSSISMIAFFLVVQLDPLQTHQATTTKNVDVHVALITIQLHAI